MTPVLCWGLQKMEVVCVCWNKSGDSSQTWGKVGGCQPDNKINDVERRKLQVKEKRWCSNNWSMEGRRGPWNNFSGKIPLQEKHAAKTIQSARSHRPADLFTPDTGQRAVTGLLSRWAGFSSLESESWVVLCKSQLNHNNLKSKKKKSSRRGWWGVGNGLGPRQVRTTRLCVQMQHGVIQVLAFHNTTQHKGWCYGCWLTCCV